MRYLNLWSRLIPSFVRLFMVFCLICLGVVDCVLGLKDLLCMFGFLFWLMLLL